MNELKQALEITGWPEWEEAFYRFRLGKGRHEYFVEFDNTSDGPENWDYDHDLHPHEAHALLEKHFMEWLVKWGELHIWSPTQSQVSPCWWVDVKQTTWEANAIGPIAVHYGDDTCLAALEKCIEAIGKEE